MEWVRIDAVVLTADEREVVLRRKLNDIVINCSQAILHQQLPQMFLDITVDDCEVSRKMAREFPSSVSL